MANGGICSSLHHSGRRRLAALIAGLLAAALAIVVVAPPATAVPAWGPDTRLPADPVGAVINPSIVVDGTGNATAVWVWRAADGKGIVQASRRPAGGAWTTPVNLSRPGDSVFPPSIAINHAGAMAVMWGVETPDYHTYLQVTTSTSGGSWSTPDNVTSPTKTAQRASIAIGGDGVVTVAFLHWAYQSPSVVQAVSGVAGDWKAPVSLSDSRYDVSAPDVVADTLGNATVAWTTGTPVRDLSTVESATRVANGTWLPTVNVSPLGEPDGGVDLAVDAAGNVTAVWTHTIVTETGTDDVVRVATRTLRDGWGSYVELTSPERYYPRTSVAAGPAGTTVATWWGAVGTNQAGIWVADKTADGWGQPEVVAILPRGNPLPQAVVDPAGNTTVSWAYNNGDTEVLWATTRPKGGAWSTPVALSAPDQYVSNAHLAAGVAGRATVVWNQGYGIDSHALSRDLEVGGVDSSQVVTMHAPATGRTGQSLTYAARATRAATFRWTFGDGSPAVTGRLVSHVFAKAGSYTITVTATESNGRKVSKTARTVITGPAMVAPVLSAVSLSPKTITRKPATKAGKAKLSLKANVAASLKVAFIKKGSAKPAAHLTKQIKAGVNTLVVTAKIGTKLLKPGIYVLKIQATNAAGTSKSTRVRLTVRR